MDDKVDNQDAHAQAPQRLVASATRTQSWGMKAFSLLLVMACSLVEVVLQAHDRETGPGLIVCERLVFDPTRQFPQPRGESIGASCGLGLVSGKLGRCRR